MLGRGVGQGVGRAGVTRSYLPLPVPPLPVIERYVLRQMVGPLLATLAVALLLLLVERLIRLLDAVLAVHGPLRVVVEMVTFLVPHYLGMALPLGLFLAVLLTFGRLGREGELDGFHAAGISLFRLIVPVMIAALVTAVATFAVLGYLQPYARYAYRTAVFDVKNAAALALLEEGVFTKLEGATVLVGRISADRTQVENVFVHKEGAGQEDPGQEGAGSSVVITAPSGHTTGGRAPVVDLFHGVRMEVAAAGSALRTEAASTNVLVFESLRTPIGTDDTIVFRPRGKDERELTLGELWRGPPPADVEPSRVAAELHARLVRIAMVLALPMLAVPLGQGRNSKLQPYRLAAGLLVLVVYNEVVQVGEALTAAGRAGPLVALWVPFGCLVAGSLAAFVMAASGRSLRRPAWLDGGRSARAENARTGNARDGRPPDGPADGPAGAVAERGRQ